ncbi:MAG: tetraacyldisaccharide 4'-kinase [Methylotenera sp.]|uniref:tetraacyldisaccharide 4'-kinase n=1 Tax=Methylotenera sp. TaxID=2051956 RepID=UPI002487489F|nr:tetraacyldisaccharide 4'-kinase [Methylotenera sp.]MDI1310260.1 tetraacyldisaccharide 4'-kinase [Methylotenera sp.]
MNNWFQKQWSTYSLWHILLIPLSWIFLVVISVRKTLYKVGWLKSTGLSVPVIVVGNVTVGGTGKTPFVIWLAEQLQLAGYKPGIISRGYGGKSKLATPVFANSDPQLVGDEPVLISKRTTCPMFVGTNRVAAGQALLQENPQCNVIISDDGLQHYALWRNVEIALVNSNSRFGNQRLLPAGPLREKLTRLRLVDAIVDSGKGAAFVNTFKEAKQTPIFNMSLQGELFESVDGSGAKQPVSYFADKKLVAIAGIGNPERFFDQLSDLGLQFERKPFADHHAFTKHDLMQFAGKTILMTEKDAVKCSAFTTNDSWCLPVAATISSTNQASLAKLILQKLGI